MWQENTQFLQSILTPWLKYSPVLISIAIVKILITWFVWSYNLLSASQIILIWIAYKISVCAIAFTIANKIYAKKPSPEEIKA